MRKQKIILRAFSNAAFLVVLVLCNSLVLFSGTAKAQSSLKISQDVTYNFESLFNDANENTPQAPVISSIAVKETDIFAGADDRRVYRFDSETGIPVSVCQSADSWVRSIAFSPVANEIAVLSQNGQLTIWDPDTQTKMREAREKTKGAHAFAYSPNGKVIAVAGFEPYVEIYDASTLKKLQSWSAPSMSSTAIQFSHFGDLLAVGGRNGVVRVWNTQTGTVAREFVLSEEGSDNGRRVRAIAFSADDSLIAIGGEHSQILVYNAKTGALTSKLILPSLKDDVSDSTRAIPVGKGKVYSLTFYGAGNLLVSGDSLNRVVLWDAASGINTINLSEGYGHTGTVSTLLYVGKDEHPDGPFILSSGFDTTIIRWKIEE